MKGSDKVILIFIEILLVITFIRGILLFKNNKKEYIEYYNFRKFALCLIPVLLVINLIQIFQLNIF